MGQKDLSGGDVERLKVQVLHRSYGTRSVHRFS